MGGRVNAEAVFSSRERQEDHSSLQEHPEKYRPYI
jgi:hypothetical protein